MGGGGNGGGGGGACSNAICPFVVLSEAADTDVTCSNGAEHTSTAAIRMRIDFLRCIVPPSILLYLISISFESNSQLACKFNNIAIGKRMMAGSLNFCTVDLGAIGAAAVFGIVLTVFVPDIDMLSGYVRDMLSRYEFLKVTPAEGPGIACQ